MPDRAALPFTVELQVRGYEIDVWGHTNNAVYLHWLEHARWELGRAGGFAPLGADVLPMVRHMALDYRRETLLGDSIRVALWPRTVANTSFTLGSSIRITAAGDPSRTGQIALLCTQVLTCVRRPEGKVRVPDAFRAAFPPTDPGEEPPATL